jgi:hypothetical protein
MTRDHSRNYPLRLFCALCCFTMHAAVLLRLPPWRFDVYTTIQMGRVARGEGKAQHYHGGASFVLGKCAQTTSFVNIGRLFNPMRIESTAPRIASEQVSIRPGSSIYSCVFEQKINPYISHFDPMTSLPCSSHFHF